MDKIRHSIIQSAFRAAGNLRDTADRLQRAAEAEDFQALSEIQLSIYCWPLDQIRGAAMVVARSEKP